MTTENNFSENEELKPGTEENSNTESDKPALLRKLKLQMKKKQ